MTRANMRRVYSHDGERGSTLVFWASILVVVFVFLVVGFGVVGATTIKISQESALSAIREYDTKPAVALRAKNSTDPGFVLARSMVDGLRQSKVQETVEVWFYEVPAKDLTPDRRVYAYEVVLKAPYDVPFGGAVGIKQVEITSSVVSLSAPYAEFASWRPAAPRIGVFRATANSSDIAFESRTLASMPSGIQDAISTNQES